MAKMPAKETSGMEDLANGFKKGGTKPAPKKAPKKSPPMPMKKGKC